MARSQFSRTGNYSTKRQLTQRQRELLAEVGGSLATANGFSPEYLAGKFGMHYMRIISALRSRGFLVLRNGMFRITVKGKAKLARLKSLSMV